MNKNFPNSILQSGSASHISAAAEIINKGGLVAFPTETVYGLGADATNDKAVAKIFEVKQRPTFNPLIIHFSDKKKVNDIVEIDTKAIKLAKAFWPGALTMVLPRKKKCNVSLLASAGLKTLAVRVPDHPLAQSFINATGVPIAAPSANKSGEISPSAAEHVLQSLDNKIDVILDGGPCCVGIESTVIDLSARIPALLRPGSITHQELESVIGRVSLFQDETKPPNSPGMLYRHYAPSIPLRLNAEKAEPGEALLAFGQDVSARHANLSRLGDLTEAAANLFAMLRMLDQPEFIGIAVMKIPNKGLGVAINDRLKRAATN